MKRAGQFDPAAAVDAIAIAGDVRRGAVSAREVVDACLARIETLNPTLNAFSAVHDRRARQTAARIDAVVAAGGDPGPLAGVPFAVKNLFDVAGETTLAGSAINRDDAAAVRDAVLIERLEAAGAILSGSLHMGEYAYDFTGENAHYGPCRNPHALDRMSGGSSSGSGAATAAALVPLTLGSDTNGSIRVPSALCGVFGLKPTYGRTPRSGTFPFCASLDHLGPLARSVADLALTTGLLAGADRGDPAAVDRPAPDLLDAIDRGAGGLRIAVAGGYFAPGDLDEAGSAVARVAAALDVTTTVDLPGAAEARAAAFIITNVESAAFHHQRLRHRADEFDPDTRDRFLAGLLVPGHWYVRAQAVRAWFAENMRRLFRDVDVIVAPAVPCRAPKLGEKILRLGARDMPLRANLGMFTQPLSAIGLPVCLAPLAQQERELPLGVQLVAAPWREDLCLRVARALECEGICAPTPVPASTAS